MSKQFLSIAPVTISVFATILIDITAPQRIRSFGHATDTRCQCHSAPMRQHLRQIGQIVRSGAGRADGDGAALTFSFEVLLKKSRLEMWMDSSLLDLPLPRLRGASRPFPSRCDVLTFLRTLPLSLYNPLYPYRALRWPRYPSRRFY